MCVILYTSVITFFTTICYFYQTTNIGEKETTSEGVCLFSSYNPIQPWDSKAHGHRELYGFARKGQKDLTSPRLWGHRWETLLPLDSLLLVLPHTQSSCCAAPAVPLASEATASQPLSHETLVSEPKEEVAIRLKLMPGVIRWCPGIRPNSPRKQRTFSVTTYHVDSGLSHHENSENSVAARGPLLARIPE